MFGKTKSKYPISEAQAQQRAVRGLQGLAYVVIAVLVLITGAHAVMLVLSESAAFTLAGYGGILLYFLTALRIGFPLVVEVAAVIGTVGAIKGYWRGDQKTWAAAIDGIWLFFAAANMITFFTIERGAELEGWQRLWLNYGLPVSGIIAGVFVIRLIRADPDHQRAEEETAAAEERTANEFNARSNVENSEAMKLVQQRKIWRDYALGLRAQGYTEDEIGFILSHVPELRGLPASAASSVQTAAPDPSLINRALAALGLSNTTQAAPRQIEPPAAAATPAGQGERTPVYANLAHLTPDQLRQMAADLDAGRAATLNPNGQEVHDSRPQ